MDDETLTRTLCRIIGQLPTFVVGDAGAMTADSVGVFYGAIDDAPDKAVGVRVYGAIDQPDLHSRRVQLHIRGARDQPFGADRIASVLFSVLHERPRRDGIAAIFRTSAAALGADQNARQERTDNYLITLDNLEASL